MKRISLRYKDFFRHPLFAFLFGLLSCFAVTLHFLQLKERQETLKREIRYLDQKNRNRKKIAQREENLIERLKRADPDYVQKTLETLVFLDGETKRIETVLLDSPDDKAQARRLQFLKGDTNRLQFREKNFQRVGKFQEIDVIQEHPVEMGPEDLKLLLSKLEHAQIGPYNPDPTSPDFLIEQFEMIRKSISKDEEIFQLQFNCIKREYVHE